MLDSLSSYAALAMTRIFPKVFTTADYEITVPFDIRCLSYFSTLRAKTLWRTKTRWCWFDKASKEDDDAGTRLGTLRFLPYEIRQQIFEIVLEDHFVEVEDYLRYEAPRWPEGDPEDEVEVEDNGPFLDRLMLQIRFWARHCSCERDRIPNVFDLRSYFVVDCRTEKLPMGLRLASKSIQQEFDRIFLSRRTFQFTCPFTINRFLDQLSPIQQRQLKRLNIDMFVWWGCSSARLTPRDQWMRAFERLPPGLQSVELRSPRPLNDVLRFWTEKAGPAPPGPAEDRAKIFAMGLLDAACKKITRASPRAVITWIGREKLGTEDNALLDAGLAELEPWSEEWHTYIDGQNV